MLTSCCDTSSRRSAQPTGTLVVRCSWHVSLEPVKARLPSGGAGLPEDL